MTEKDLTHCRNLIKLLNTKAKFDLDTREVVELYSAFAWLDSLSSKIEESLKPVAEPKIENPEPKLPKPRAARRKKAKRGKSK